MLLPLSGTFSPCLHLDESYFSELSYDIAPSVPLSGRARFPLRLSRARTSLFLARVACMVGARTWSHSLLQCLSPEQLCLAGSCPPPSPRGEQSLFTLGFNSTFCATAQGPRQGIHNSESSTDDCKAHSW